MIKEFKAFLMRGNVVELAVAVLIAAAFGKIVTALNEGLISPIIGAVLGGVDFATKATTINGVRLAWGGVVQTVIDFVLVGFVLFMIVKAANKAQKQEEEEEAPAGPSQEDLLTEIRDLLKK